MITSTSTITRDVDLRTFRVTGDAANLYLYLNTTTVVSLSGSKAPEFQVAIDTGPGGNTSLINDPATINASAAWEYLVQTRFSTNGVSGIANTVAPLVHAAAGGSSSSGTVGLLKSAGVDTAELKIPWSLIGGAPPTGGKQLRFSVATLFSDRTNVNDGTPSGSAVMDGMSPSQNAKTDLADGMLGYSVSAYFDAKGEVFSPLAITEFLASQPAQGTQWIEIANTSGFSIELSAYKLGDAAKPLPGNSEGMFQFPSKTLTPGSIVILANNKTVFNNLYPSVVGTPNVTIYGISDGDVSKYTAWGNGNTLTLPKAPAPADTSFEEQIVLLDGSDSLVDVVTYISSSLPNSAAQPGMIPLSIPSGGIPTDRSYERCPATRDTNDASFDLIAHDGKAAQTPGALCDGKTSLLITQATPSTVAVGGRIEYTLTYANSGASATNVYITDTLPLNVSYVPGSQVANPAFGSSPIVFTDLGGGKLQWKLPLVGTGSGSISFSAQLANTIPPGQVLSNSATIAGPLADSNTGDNSSSATTTVTATSLADVAIAKALISPPESFYSGRPAVYTLTYSNSGDLPAMNTLITDSIPSGLTFVSASRAPSTADAGKLVFDVGTVAGAVDQTIVVTFTVSAPAAGGTPIVNIATIDSATTPEPIKGNNVAAVTATTVAVPPVDLALAKVANVSTAQIGGEIGYELAMTNLGGDTASGIQVVDTLPKGLAYKPGSSTAAVGEPQISGDGRTLTWILPASFTVSTGATRAFQFKMIATPAGAGTALVNNAVVTVAGDGNTDNDAATSQPTSVDGVVVFLPLIGR
ncbi:MAG TPA: lamin tail domain-containing protein [Roseiflexaceae bacterium]|nr:lamin tail domain-containing protein [Roseiflexaceae bacterium]